MSMEKHIKLFEEFINETGEWIGDADQIEWMNYLKGEMKTIQAETHGKLKLMDVRGFDNYQGPYASVKIANKFYRVWTIAFENEPDGLLYIEDYPVSNSEDYQKNSNPGFIGTTQDIIDLLS